MEIVLDRCYELSELYQSVIYDIWLERKRTRLAFQLTKLIVVGYRRTEESNSCWRNRLESLICCLTRSVRSYWNYRSLVLRWMERRVLALVLVLVACSRIALRGLCWGGWKVLVFGSQFFLLQRWNHFFRRMCSRLCELSRLVRLDCIVLWHCHRRVAPIDFLCLRFWSLWCRIGRSISGMPVKYNELVDVTVGAFWVTTNSVLCEIVF